MLKDRVMKFWECIDKAEFDELKNIILQDASVRLPNTREIFNSRDKFIQFNKDYPGRWYAEVEKIVELEDQVISVARVTDRDKIDLYVTSFFTFKGDMIQEVEEYWGDNGEPPEWRLDKGYSERY